MRFLVFGATGLTGQEIVKQGLELGHEITAFVRNPMKLTINHPNLSSIVGDVTDTQGVRNAVAGYDVVVSALGTRTPFKGDVFSVGVKNIADGMHRHGVKRLVVMSAFGVGDSQKKASSPFLKIAARTILKPTFDDKAKGERYLLQGDLDFTCIHPVLLTNGPKLGFGRYRTGEHIRLGMMPKISRADVADFMLRIAADKSTIRKTIVISY